jgi:hypothetical protein
VGKITSDLLCFLCFLLFKRIEEFEQEEAEVAEKSKAWFLSFNPRSSAFICRFTLFIFSVVSSVSLRLWGGFGLRNVQRMAEGREWSMGPNFRRSLKGRMMG